MLPHPLSLTSLHPLTHEQGKWTVPKIPNPDYKGPWAPRKIANPAFFEDLHPSDFTKIGGVGIELWTMTEDILCKSFFKPYSCNKMYNVLTDGN